MQRRYVIFLLVVCLFIFTVVLEKLIGPKDINENLPVKELIKCEYEYASKNTKVNIDLLGINSNSYNAKIINKEIMNIFYNAENISNTLEKYTGNYEVISEYNVINGILSLRIYEIENSNDKDNDKDNNSGNIYSVCFDLNRNERVTLTEVMNNKNLNYSKEIENAKKVIYKKEKYIYIDFPYFYINKKGNIELVVKTVINTGKNKYINNIEFYEIKNPS